MTPRNRIAKITGVLYLLVALLSAFAHFAVRGTIHVPGDAAATARNVAEHATLLRFGFAADLTQATLMIFVGFGFCRLLGHVSRNAARLLMLFVAAASATMALNLVHQSGALLVATGPSYATAFGKAGSDALVLLLLDLNAYGFLIAQIFFALWLAPLGYLAYRSGFFPKTLGVVLGIGCLGYLTDMYTRFLVPGIGAEVSPFAIVPAAVAELWLLGYVLVKRFR
ncbi:DUF4386 domain-containing protein [Longispora albida]|uniref:DUF4386 domain-containing protein n=1 Tax=Longispora albida TaxID=203523 RepID=UPI000360B09E|nr:DUF4386 domain-containing protein [Longispora albida]